MSARFVLKRAPDGQFSFLFLTHSGQVLLTSPAYTDKERALRRISAARQMARNRHNYEIVTGANGSSFLVRGKHGDVLGQSESFPDAQSLEAGINLVRANAKGARLEDLTPTASFLREV